MLEYKEWYGGIWIVKISTVEDVEGFSEWLRGQTLPYIEGDEDPTGWAYYADYSRFMQKLPIID